MSEDIKRLNVATHVTIKTPQGKPHSPRPIVLDTGDYVWVPSDYSDVLMSYLDVKQVGDGRSKGYGHHGDCVISVPASWCTFHDEKEAGEILMAEEADECLLSYAI